MKKSLNNNLNMLLKTYSISKISTMINFRYIKIFSIIIGYLNNRTNNQIHLNNNNKIIIKKINNN